MASPDRSTALYRMYGHDGELLYIGITWHPAYRISEGHALDKPWWTAVGMVRIEHHPSRQAALTAERAAIATERPRFNVTHNHPQRPSATARAKGKGEGVSPQLAAIGRAHRKALERVQERRRRAPWDAR